MAIILALSSAVGALYGGFEMYKRFQDMSAAIEAYQEPDLSGFDKKIALVESNTNAQMEIVKTIVLYTCRTQQQSLKNVKKFKNMFPAFKRFPIKVRIQKGN